MEKIAKNLQLILMCIILISTVIAVGIEIKNMFHNQSVTLADLLLMFLYLEVLAMVRVFWDQQSISITLPLLIAITALARFIILQGKEMDLSICTLNCLLWKHVYKRFSATKDHVSFLN